MSARIVEAIMVDRLIGEGVEWNPSRRLLQLWSKDGQLIAEYDAWREDATDPGKGKAWQALEPLP